MDRRRVPEGWAAWFLVLAAALPAAVTVRIGWVFLGGAMDDYYGTVDPPLTGLDLLGNRWSGLWGVAGVLALLLTAVLPVVVLAALTVAGRPRPLVPTGAPRTAATLVAAAVSALGFAGIVGFLAQLLGLLPVSMWSGFSSSQLDVFAPAAAATVVTGVLGGACTWALWPRDDDPAEVDDPPEDEVEFPVDAEPGTGVDPQTPALGDQAPAVFPALGPDDADLYRR